MLQYIDPRREILESIVAKDSYSIFVSVGGIVAALAAIVSTFVSSPSQAATRPTHTVAASDCQQWLNRLTMDSSDEEKSAFKSRCRSWVAATRQRLYVEWSDCGDHAAFTGDCGDEHRAYNAFGNKISDVIDGPFISPHPAFDADAQTPPP